jgi:hypothetical protein
MEWGFRAAGCSRERVQDEGGYSFRGGLSGVEIARGIGWFVPYCWASELLMLAVTGSNPRKGWEREWRSNGLQWGGVRDAVV